jgi:hypothetical protein
VATTGDPADATRLPSSPPTTPGWLTSSDAISHGRFAPGSILKDRYRIIGLLGKGGMGEVYRADDLKLAQPVALKFLPPDIAADSTRLAQFHGEVRLARQISHPNVCRVYDIDEVDGAPFLSMEYVDGEDLASLLRRIGRLPEDKAVEMARQLCAGVAAAHARGVLHRDLKPANVMIDGRGQVRVMDFGLAVVSGSVTEIRAGTPAYMAPEQLAGREVTVRSDVYALGLVLFEMFTGRRTFDAGDLTELLRQQDQAITAPTTIVAGLDPAIERAILRCVDRDPAARPASALAVAAALPGGDPLAAALAAGETPSPAMVAAAGEQEALPIALAIGGVVVVAVLLMALALLADRVLLLRSVGPIKAVDVLVDRAQAIRASLGYTDPPADDYHSVTHDQDYLNHIEATDSTLNRWERLNTGRPAALLFWYRTSPRELIRFGVSGAPTPADPPLSVSGMTTVTTDMQGRLVQFDAVAPQRDAAATPAPAPDWKPLFSAADLAMESFVTTTPTWTPRTYADTRAAWEGTLPEDPATRIRVEAASYRGRPVFFQIIGPWSRAGRMEVAQTNGSNVIVAVLATIMVCALYAGAAIIARQHLRRGRGDRAGARRLMIIMMTTLTAAWLLRTHHVTNLDAELTSLFVHVAVSLVGSASVWLFYLALEPLVRKWNPRALVGWTRLLGGTFNDAHVGRDVLVGVIAGATFALIRMPRGTVRALAGTAASAPLVTSFSSLLSVRAGVADLLELLQNAITNAMMLVFAFAVLRMVFRRTSVTLAVLSFVLVGMTAFNLLSAPGRWTEFVLVFLAGFVMFAVVVRFGLLATLVMLYVWVLLEVVPITADPSARYFGMSSFVLLLVFSVALFAAYAARARQPLFKLADD